MADTSTAALVLRLALSLGLVLALVGGVTWVLRRRGLLRPGPGGGRGGRLEVLDRRSLNKHASIVLARVGGTSVLLGVTEQRVEVLSSADGLDAAWIEAPATAAPALDLTAFDTTALESPVPDTTSVAPTPTTPVMGARRTGLPVAAIGASTPPARMNVVEALRELTVRRS